MKETLGWLIITMGLAGCTSLWVPPTQEQATVVPQICCSPFLDPYTEFVAVDK
jgi:hypothetical protein